MALETTQSYANEFSDTKTELPATADDHKGYHVVIAQVAGRRVKGVRDIIEVHFVTIAADKATGVMPGMRHTETYWIDDKEGTPAPVPRRILSGIIRAASDGDKPVDFDIAETVSAHLLGRYVRIQIKESGSYGPQIKAVFPPEDRAKAQAAVDKYDPDLAARLTTTAKAHLAMLAQYEKTGRWPTALTPPPDGQSKPNTDDFTDDAIPL
jgi:hypothetical protein